MNRSVLQVLALTVGTAIVLMFFSGCLEKVAANTKKTPVVSGKADQDVGQIILNGSGGVAAVFKRSQAGYKWTGYRDLLAQRSWRIKGKQLTFETTDGKTAGTGQRGFEQLSMGEQEAARQVILRTKLREVGIEVKRIFFFADDGRTLRMKTWIRSVGKPVDLRRVGLMEIGVEGENFHLTGNKLASFPVFGNHVWAGVEHYSAFCKTDGASISIYRYFYEKLGNEWTELPAGVFGSASKKDLFTWGKRGVRKAFLRYLDTIRIKLTDLEIHTNNWWTVKCPFDEDTVLKNIADLKAGLYDTTGMFFDSCALDLGWSDLHSIWDVDERRFPNRLHKISDILSRLNCRLGIWVSPASCYPPGLDNKWLKESGYEVLPFNNSNLANVNACFAIGNRYQKEFRDNVLKHARDYKLGHMKFDAFQPICDIKEHGHPTGEESYRFTADGIADVIDGLRKVRPNIVTEPLTVCGYPASPWWLTRTQIVLAAHGDDVPHGISPSPEWIQSLITGRDAYYATGCEEWLMPSDALESFDIIVQYEHDIEDLCVIAVGRGRWFISTYFNPEFMNPQKWTFFAELMRWARHNREDLRNAEVIGGNPTKWEPYGYAFYDNPDRQLYCVRNPWMEPASIVLEELPGPKKMREVRTLYPRREVLAHVAADAKISEVDLGPYEMLFIEVVSTENKKPVNAQVQRPKANVSYMLTEPAGAEKLIFEGVPEVNVVFQTVEDADLKEALGLSLVSEVDIRDVRDAEVCVLVDGRSKVAYSKCRVTVDGKQVNPQISCTKGAFSATGHPQKAFWKWFTVPVELGRHSIAIEAVTPLKKARFGVYLRGCMDAGPAAASFGCGPNFPLYNPDSRAWSKTILPLTEYSCDTASQRSIPHTITSIDGVYLDTLEWFEATSGNKPVQRRKTIEDNPIYLSGRKFERGLGTHANSRIGFDLPDGFKTFAATIGCSVEGYYGGRVVFVVEGDGRELYRSKVIRLAHGGRDIEIPIKGLKKLTLVVEDGGDGIGNDHALWADARLLR